MTKDNLLQPWSCHPRQVPEIEASLPCLTQRRHPEHLSYLLSELHLLAINVIEVTNSRHEDFKIGFHAQPSMQRLHIHVISKDFVSDCLKTKKHWNSFNTKLFLPYDELRDDLENHGKVQKMNKELTKELELTELKCNQCDLKPKTIPDLKNHLLKHLDK